MDAGALVTLGISLAIGIALRRSYPRRLPPNVTEARAFVAMVVTSVAVAGILWLPLYWMFGRLLKH